MKNKRTRIISAVMTVLMVFTAFAALIPINAEAAHSPSSSVSGSSMSLESIKSYVNDEYLKYNYDTAEEMLNDELAKGYLDSALSKDGRYSIYVNRYTGFLFYRDNLSGQILTSNPVNPGYGGINTNETLQEVMSQIYITYSEASNSTKEESYSSVKWAALYGQISTSAIANGLRVNYTLGDTSTRLLLPGRATAESLETYVLIPIFEAVEDRFAMAYPDTYFTFFDNPAYSEDIYLYGCLNFETIRAYMIDVEKYMNQNKEEAISIQAINSVKETIRKTRQILSTYTLYNPAEYEGATEGWVIEFRDQMFEDYPVTKEGIAIYVCGATNMANIRERSRIIQEYCPEYTFAMMYEDEATCGYVYEAKDKFVLRCSLEYTFNDDGTLSVRLPANSISFDESVFILGEIKLLQYFGCGDMSKTGSVFYPDGSGTVIEFEDFYDTENGKFTSLSIKGAVFGNDYCFSEITGAHREQITMPVYGMVYTETLNATTVSALAGFGIDMTTAKNGFFAVIEDGESLANISVSSAGSTHNYISSYVTYKPYPSDKFDLAESLSVGGLGVYIKVSDTRYNGSYVTRIKMLSDAKIGETLLRGDYNVSSYSGMAAYYRDYLKANGTLSAIELASSELPLYIEALGSMKIDDKFLTFPVKKSIALTSFENVSDMFESFYNAREHIQSLIDENTKLMEESTDDIVKAEYQQKIQRYEELLKDAKGIKNINFRLTGFANGGMESTYPAKLKWERACGGKSGFKELAANSAAISDARNVNFGIYPDFDFMYIEKTAMFDGISKKSAASRMIDNRYATKQVYDAVVQSYESFLTLVVSTDAIEELYGKFSKKYSKYEIDSISLSTMGSDLNSDFDAKKSTNRDKSQENVVSVLDKIANQQNYSVMIDKGNIYAVKYADHILNISTDSSNFRDSSYAVPFVGMVLHGHVSYAGSPLNYSGNVEYDILRSIENGAAPYYILCYQNTSHMKDDEFLSDYYGVDYVNWYDEVIRTYKEMNDAIGDLQDYEITDHKTLIGEREIEDSEKEANRAKLETEILVQLDAQIRAAVAQRINELKDVNDLDARVKVTYDKQALFEQFAEILDTDSAKLSRTGFADMVSSILNEYAKTYPGASDESLNSVVAISGIDYESEYDFKTDSEATDADYDTTDYTLDNGRIVMVTYEKNGKKVSFVLNYNIYSVNVKINGTVYTLEKYGYIKLG